jgi:hypothetical protein
MRLGAEYDIVVNFDAGSGFLTGIGLRGVLSTAGSPSAALRRRIPNLSGFACQLNVYRDSRHRPQNV